MVNLISQLINFSDEPFLREKRELRLACCSIGANDAAVTNEMFSPDGCLTDPGVVEFFKLFLTILQVLNKAVLQRKSGMCVKTNLDPE